MGGNRRRLRRGGTLMATLGLLLLTLTATAALPSDFVDDPVITGLDQPSNLEFAPDGRVFVAEKSGVIKVFDSVSDPTPDVFADLSSNVHDFWDRGLLGLAIHPDFPDTPYVYALYTHGVPLDDDLPEWGDGCPSPPGPTNDGCVVSGRLSRLEASGNQMTGPEDVLIDDWCQQYPSHSIADLAFGPDGALYAGAGDGASFNWVDYGQGGGDSGSPTPVNPCSDPIEEGGALRSQDLETSGDPVTLDGTIIRIDPMTGDALPDNPAFGSADENEARIVAYGLRNPYRMTIDPSTGSIFAGDVGWNTWEEVNEISNPTSTVANFGWPCYEGSNGSSSRQGGYDNENLDICEDLYTSGSVTAPLFAYRHNQDITPADECPPASPPQGTSSSTSGLAFYEGGNYPGSYNGALFGADYSRGCIWMMPRDSSGELDPSGVQMFHPDATGPVDLEIGPAGDLFYVNINHGEIRRIRFVGENTPPAAVIDASTTSGSAPLSVDFDGSGSTDADEDPIIGYEWDLDGDGAYDDDTGVEVSHDFSEPGSYTVRLRVTDARGESDTDSVSIQASNSAPSATIDTPSNSLLWHVGETISFSGSATDPDEGVLPASAMTWDWILHHCETDGSCHEHHVETVDGEAGGAFDAPDHEYPSSLELRLTVVDQFGVSDTDSVELQPETVELTFETDPADLDVSFFGDSQTAPLTETLIVGSSVQVSTEEVQSGWTFQSWSNGGERSQLFAAPDTDTTYTAHFDTAPQIETSQNQSVPENQPAVVDVDSTDNSDAEGDGLAYSVTGGEDSSRFEITPGTGDLSFVSAPDFEDPSDTGEDNSYEVEVTVTDSSGLNDSLLLLVDVLDVDEAPVAADDSVSTLEDQPVMVSVVANDNDPEGSLDMSSVVVTSQAGHGSAAVGLDGSITYTPDQNWHGSDSLAYTIDDDGGATSNPATVSITVDSVNDPPTADAGSDESVTLGESLTLDGSGSDDPVEGSSLSFHWSIVSAPPGSSTTLTGASTANPRLTPDTAGLFEIELVVDDGSDTATDLVAVSVSEVQSGNLAPEITSNGGGSSASVAVDEGSTLVTDVQASDPDGDSEGSGLAYSLPGGADRDLFQIGGNGVLRFGEAPDFENPGDSNGDNVYVVRVEVTDSGGLSDTQDLQVTVRDVSEAYDGTFRDDDDSQFESAIEWLAQEKITLGCNPPANDEFCPDDFVTRAQMAAFFARGFDWTDAGEGDLFVDDDDSIFERAIDMMGTAGVTQGCNPPANDEFCPGDFVTRGQMAAFFKRAWSG